MNRLIAAVIKAAGDKALDIWNKLWRDDIGKKETKKKKIKNKKEKKGDITGNFLNPPYTKLWDLLIIPKCKLAYLKTLLFFKINEVVSTKKNEKCKYQNIA